VSLAIAIRMTAAALAIGLLNANAGAQETSAVNLSQEQPAESSVKQPAPEEKARTPDSEAPQGGATFENWKDKLSYAMGVDWASSVRAQRVDVNVDLLVMAFKDALAGKKLSMTRDEIIATLKRAESEQKEDFNHAKAMLSEKNKKAGQALFAENLKKEDVVTLPSGLQYKVLKRGDGRKPTLEDTVVCQYRGTLLDGTEFDSSYKRNQPATVPVKGVIKGWSEALQGMPVGSKWQLFIPPQLAYGERIVGGIAPNATLIFEIELLSIQDKPPPTARAAN
jgi:FKBP-type peptidyl-prolyl cis-trans isomerase FklB